MARKYVRDNRGRFATTGATARGGRLKTAAGNKRATQTIQAKAAPAATAVKRPAGFTGKPGPRARRVANSIAKGNLVRTSDADRRRFAQNRATAERALAEVRRKPPRNAFGLDRNAVYMAEKRVEGLQGNIPAYSKPNRAETVVPNRNALARKRAAKENDRIMSEFRASTAPKAAAPAPAPKAKSVLPKSLAKADKGAAYMQFMDRAQAVTARRRARDASDYNLKRRDRKAARSAATAARAEKYVYSLQGRLLRS
jgi:hypothetical protein